MLSIHSTHLSLDKPVYDGSDKTFQEMIAPSGNETAENAIIDDSLKISVAEMIKRLTWGNKP
jgi:DNA-directed RNA polymerase sigma subunit (sigma70/sigma32)